MLPLMVVIALCIKLSSKGPVFYKGLRVKRSGVVFICMKFRTMHINSDNLLDKALKDEKSSHEWLTYLKLKNDPRVTFFGKFLRRTSLDELPQFFNVVKGDLSVVGPRPFMLSEANTLLGQKKRKILSIKPGITGLWQTSGRNLLMAEDRIKLDEIYVDKRNFFLDLKLIAKTIFVVISAKGAY